jgi:hypothetical protein
LEGKPTADPHALDGDAILAAQVSLLGLPPGSYVVATTNPNHFAALGIEAKEWLTILP